MPDRIATLRQFDPVLTQIALDYKFPENSGFNLFPVVMSDYSGGKIAKFNKESFMLIDTTRAIGAKSKRVVKSSETIDFSITSHSLESAVDDREYEDATEPVKQKLLLESSRVKNLEFQVGIKLEYDQAKQAENPTNYPAGHVKDLSLTGNKQWNDENSVPLDIIDEGKEVIRSTVGVYPNVLHLSPEIWAVLKRHPRLLKKGTPTERDYLTIEILQEIWEIPKIVIGKSVYTLTPKSDFINIWEKHAILAYVPENPLTIDEPSFGYTIRRNGYPKVDKYRDESCTSDVIRSQDTMGAAFVGSIAGYLIRNAVK